MAQFAFLDTTLPQAMAHRGGTDVAPENTMAAFSHAIELGYRYIETDVHLSSDGVLVVSHDPDLKRLAGEKAKIEDLSWDELQRFDLGEGERLARLDEVFASFPTTRFNIEPKSDASVGPLAAAINQAEAIDRVCIGSFSQGRLRSIRELLGPTLCTSPAQSEFAAVLKGAYLRSNRPLPYGCVQIPPSFKGKRLDKPTLIARLQSMGLQVHYWTINDAEEMKRLFSNGADMIMTDKVGLAKQVLEESGHWQPPATN